MQGIYQIMNTKNGKIYIGSAKNITYRWNQHLHELYLNIHKNYKLQNDYNKFGIESFSFSILEIVIDKKLLLNREQYYIDCLDSIEDNYNILSYTSLNYLDRIKDNYSIINYKISDKDKKYLINNIKIFNNEKLNLVGNEKTYLNKSWYNNCSKSEFKTLKNNIYNFRTNIIKDSIYWICFISYQKYITPKGCKKSFVGINDIPVIKRNNLIFLMNMFINPIIKRNLNINDDKYAINILLKWIINVSDITKPINIYIPSKRMRNLLYMWLNNEKL
jgi:group I intron endonuclease